MSPMFIETVFKTTFGLSDVLKITFSALNHVNNFAPPALLLRMAVINTLFVVLDKPLKSNRILLVKPLMLFT